MPATSPNLLVVHTDQQSAWTLSCYGDGPVDTPHADRLAAEGALLTNFFTNSAVCTPSRGCFMTGRYPHCNGAYVNNLALNRDEITWAEVLRRRGYRTGYVGKWHLDGDPKPGFMTPESSMGFDDCRFMFNRGHYQKITDAASPDGEPVVYPYENIGDEKSYTTDWLTDKSIDFIRATKDDPRPFCHMLSIPDPHDPFSVRAPYDTMYKPEDMAVPATFSETGLPDWAEECRASQMYALDKPNREARLRRNKAQYCGECKLIDDSLGRILAALEEQGILDETVVVFTSDHGEYMGEHGLYSKNHLYETAYRVPFLVRWPKGIPAGQRIDALLSTVDFQPTILSLLGTEPCGREQGREGASWLRGETPAWEQAAQIHHSSLACAGIFTDRYELAYVKDRDAILFDRREDPEQVKNLFGDPAHQEVTATLTRRIVEHHKEVDSPASAWLAELA